MDYVVVWPANHLPPGFSAVLVCGLALVGPAALVGYALYLWRRYLADAARAAVAFEPDAALIDGPAIVGGVVEHAADRDTAVRTEITQLGSEQESSGSWSHKWTEKSRRVDVAPFYLRRGDGTRIRIEPDPDVFLVDDMDGCILVDHTKRIRVAELVPGESVIARGVLTRDLDPEARGQAYRDSPTGWILRPARRGAMHLSSEPLERRFLRKAGFHLRAALIMLVPILVLQAFLADYYSIVLTGTNRVGTVTEKRVYTTEDDDGHETYHYRITAAIEGTNDEIAGNIERAPYRDLVERDRIAVRTSGFGDQFGTGGTIHFAFALIMLGGLIAVTVLYVAATRAARPWYAPGARVKDTGSGRLNPRTGLGDHVAVDKPEPGRRR